MTPGTNAARSDTVIAEAGARTARIFTPEHGLSGHLSAGECDRDSRLGSGIPVVSLYGPRRARAPCHLDDLDAIVVDLPDVGCRAYTYAATMLDVLAAAAKARVEVIVLDRPNPLGRAVAGPGVAAGNTSFVAPLDVPLRHGLTMGELAILGAHRRALPAPTVIPCTWDGRPCPAHALWLPPSPGLPTSETAFAYAGLVLIEGTDLSEGRGTTRPFLNIGAPWLDLDDQNDTSTTALQTETGSQTDRGSERLFQALDADHFPGIFLWPSTFRPTHGKHRNRVCHGIGLTITDRLRADPIALTVALLETVVRLAPRALAPSPFLDRLCGEDSLGRLCRGQTTAAVLLEEWQKASVDFRARRRSILLYSDTAPDPGSDIAYSQRPSL